MVTSVRYSIDLFFHLAKLFSICSNFFRKVLVYTAIHTTMLLLSTKLNYCEVFFSLGPYHLLKIMAKWCHKKHNRGPGPELTTATAFLFLITWYSGIKRREKPKIAFFAIHSTSNHNYRQMDQNMLTRLPMSRGKKRAIFAFLVSC